MELDSRVAIITRGTTGVGMALAIRLMELGAMVVIADSNEKSLVNKAKETGAVAMVADMAYKSDIKNLIDKTTQRFGRIDIFICCQPDVMSQMYAAKYVLPQMISRGDGYLVNTAPSTGLLDEFHFDMYSTIKHPSLSFSERMSAAHGKAGIKVSVLCIDESPYDAFILDNVADQVARGIRREQFMISTQLKKSNSYYREIRLSNNIAC